MKTGPVVEVPASTRARLRELRLHHWRTVTSARAAINCRPDSLCPACAMLTTVISTSLGFVQTLNDFFPLGDTAEADDNGSHVGFLLQRLDDARAKASAAEQERDAAKVRHSDGVESVRQHFEKKLDGLRRALPDFVAYAEACSDDDPSTVRLIGAVRELTEGGL